MKKKSLALNAFLNSLRSVLNIVFPLITFPYISRILTVEGIGAYNFSSSIVSYFSMIAALGISSYAIREGAKYRNDRNKIERFSDEVFTINMVSTLGAYILLFLCLIIFSKLHSYILCILIFSLQIFFTTIGTEWIYQIYEDYTYITIRSIIFQIISIILLFILVRRANDYLNYAAITVLSATGANVLNFVHARQYCHMHLVIHFNWKKHIIPILILFATSVTVMIYVNSDITLLGLMKNNYVVGIYSISSKIYLMVKTVINALVMVTIPRLAVFYGRKKKKNYNEILANLTNTLAVLVLPASIGLFMLSKEVILIISGYKYLRATSSLQILCFAYFFAVLNYVLNDGVLIVTKREKYALRGTVVSAIINIVFNLIFIPFWNENAAAISTVLAEMSLFIMDYHYSKDIVNDIFKSRELLNSLVTSVIGCVGIVIICLLCNIGFQSMLLKTILSVVLSVVIYGAILVLMKNKIALDMLDKVKMVLKNKI